MPVGSKSYVLGSRSTKDRPVQYWYRVMKSKPGSVNKVSMLYFGRKCPKGWKEISGMHLGHGLWMLRIEKVISGEKSR